MKAIFVLLALVATGCIAAPGPAIVSGSQGIDGFLKSLKSDLLDIEKQGHKRTSDRFWNKAHDHIEFTACPRENLPAAFQSVHECDRQSLALLREFVKERPKGKYTLRRRRSSGGGGGGSSSRPPRPPFTLTPVSPSPPTPDPPGPTPIAGFCDRSPGIADSIIAAMPAPRPLCGAVTQAPLNEIRTLVVTTTPRPVGGAGECRAGKSSLKAGDFANLPNLRKISFGGQESGGSGCINSVHEDTFSGLSKLREIIWGQQPIASFPEDTFRNLQALTKISLPECHDKDNDPSLQRLRDSVTVEADC